ncbi:MAG TPA: hypothetical protein VMW52_06805, partial [Phycisphaerae bacterium]|nr:hypothetical protein [Phycisphaerae bacterium]
MNRWMKSALPPAILAGLVATAMGPGARHAPDVQPPDARATDHAQLARVEPAGHDGLASGFQWLWVLDGPVSADAGIDLEMDEAGNIFLGGYTGGVDIDRDGTLDLTADGSDALFVKLTLGGPGEQPRHQWMRSARAPQFERSASVAPDRAGGMYGVGRFQQTVSFGDGAEYLSRGKNDSYIVRFTADGSVAWARVFGGPGEDALNTVASDADGNLYVVGWGEGSFPLDGGGTFPGGEGQSGAIVSYDRDGKVRWVRAVAAPNRILFSAEVSGGELFVTGFLEGGAD